ncbi:choice-of-anchor R domain-containing protein [Ruegeria sp.]|uniref:choice-of-anchor R domain-containing protein n=1 Tax=Ruegeria sp. TaxID=1879320 RepID=UPI003C7E4D46
MGVALALGLFAATGFATEAQAQSSVLVSNTGQNAATAARLRPDRAQGFTTGDNSAGYVLTSVDAVLRNLNTMGCPDLAVTIQSNSGGSPGTVVGTLTGPDNCEGTAGDHTLTFTAPGEGLDLAANTAYFIVFKGKSSATEEIVITNSGAEDTGGASGWSIANNRFFKTRGSLSWGTISDSAYKIAVKGEAKTPGVTVTPAALYVDEGDSVTYTVVLDTAPTGDVVITPTSSATAKATVSPATLTFTMTNWNEPQQVTVNGVAAGSASISHQVTKSADTTNYPTSMSIDSVAVTVTEPLAVTLTAPDTLAQEWNANNAAEIKLALPRALATGESLVIPLLFTGGEPGTDFTLALKGSPTGVALSGGTVTFTGSSGGSATAAMVKLTAIKDADTIHEQVMVSIPASSSTGGDATLTATGLPGGATGSGSATITLRDDVGRTISWEKTAVTLDESADLQFSPRLVLSEPYAADSAANQENPIVYSCYGGTATNEQDYDLNSLAVCSGTERIESFFPIGVHTAIVRLTVSASTHNDAIDEPDETFTFTLLEDEIPINNPVSLSGSDTYTLTIRDDDPTVVSLARVGSGAVTEGGTAEFTVTLGRALVAGEIIDVPLSVSGTGVTTDDWSLSLKTGTGLNTGVALSGETTATPSLRFSGAAAETARLVLTAVVDGVAEDGGETLSVALGPDDATANGFDRTSLATNVGGGADPDTGANAFTLTVNEAAELGVTVTPASLSVAEAGGTGSYTVVLDRPPSHDVVIAVASGDTNIATVSPPTLTFSTTDWDSPQPVTVTGVDDDVDQSTDRVVTVGHTVTSSDNNYNGLVAPVVSVTVTDDDNVFDIVLSRSSLGVGEGQSVTYTVRLEGSQQPTHNVMVSVTSEDTGVATVSTANGDGTLTFTPSDFQNAQTVTVTGVDDSLAQSSPRMVDLSHSATSTDPVYNAIPDKEIAVSVSDTALPVVTFAAEIVTVEEGETGSFVVTRTGDTSAALTVLLDVSIVEDFSETVKLITEEQRGHQELIIPAEQSSATYVVQTVDDAYVEPTGFAKLALRGADTYLPGKTDTAFLESLDNDDSPAVTVSGGAAVVEGTSAVFTLSTDIAKPFDLTINLSVADDGTSDFVAGGNEGDKTVTIPANQTSATYTVATEADSTDEANGVVSVTVANGDNYFPGTPDMASVTVQDDDGTVVPVLSVAAKAFKGQSLKEGQIAYEEVAGSAEFIASLTPSGSSSLTVCVRVTETIEDRVSSSNEGIRTLSIPANSGDYGFQVPWADNATDEADSVVTVEAVAPETAGCSASAGAYTVSASEASDRVRIVDDEATTASLVRDGTGAVDEGDTITFELGFDRALVAGEKIVAPFSISGTGVTTSDFTLSLKSGDGINTGVSLSGETTLMPQLTFSGAGAGPAVLELVPVMDATAESGGSETFAIQLGRGTSLSVGSNLGGGVARHGTNNGFTVMVNDLVTPEITITGGSAVTEGTGAEFTVTASPAPSADLTVRLIVADDDTSDFVASTNEGDKSVIIQSGTASATYTVATTADSIDEADGAVRVTVKADPAYTLDGPVTDTVSVSDDDEAALVFAQAADPLEVSEGGSAAYTVALATQPTATVTVTLTQPANTDVTVDTNTVTNGNQTTLSFTTVNWNAPQQVTVAAAQDVDAAVDSADILHSASGGGYASVTGTVSVTVTDDDEAALVFAQAADPLEVSEGGSAAYTVALATQPTGTVTVTLTQPTNTDVTVDTNTVTNGNQTTLSFTTVNWNAPQTVTVAAAQDVDAAVDSADILHSASGGGYASVTGTVSVTVTDDDEAALVFAQAADPLEVSEGGSATYTVALATQPTATVTVTLTQPTNTDVTVDTDTITIGNQTTLSFTTANWNAPQTVTVAAAQDVDAAVDSADILHSASGGGYASVTGTVSVTVTDDDEAALVFAQAADPLEVSEGGSAAYTVALATQPTGTVTVTLTQPNNTDVTVDTDTVTSNNQTTLSFTTVNWNAPQTVTVAAAQDVDAAVDSADILHSASGGGYASVTGTVSVTVTDDDEAALVFAQAADPLEVSEGGSAAYTVALATQPTGTVTVTLTQPTNTDVTVDTNTVTNGNQTTLSFTTVNWNAPQTVTVAAAQDVDAAVDSADILHSASGGGYASVTGTVSVTVTDDDEAALVFAQAADPLEVSEGGSAAYTVALATQPTGTVTVTLTQPTNTDVTVDTNTVTSNNQTTLSFTTVNWNAPQTVTVAAAQDVDAAVDSADILHSASGGGYASVTGTVSVTVTDDDEAALVFAQAADPLEVSEGGSAAYTVALATQPTGTVTVTLTQPTNTDVTVDTNTVTNGNQTTLSFTTVNWNAPQTVTVAAAPMPPWTVRTSFTAPRAGATHR